MIDSGRVNELSMHQVHDIGRGSFYVKLKPTRARHKGNIVYQDAFGRRITVKDAMGRPVQNRAL